MQIPAGAKSWGDQYTVNLVIVTVRIILRLHYHYLAPILTTTTTMYTVMGVTFLTNHGNNLKWPNTSTNVVCWRRHGYQGSTTTTTTGIYSICTYDSKRVWHGTLQMLFTYLVTYDTYNDSTAIEAATGTYTVPDWINDSEITLECNHEDSVGRRSH